MSEVTITLLLHVKDGEEEQTAKDIRRLLGARKAIRRLHNQIVVAKVEGPGRVSRPPRRPLPPAPAPRSSPFKTIADFLRAHV